MLRSKGECPVRRRIVRQDDIPENTGLIGRRDIHEIPAFVKGSQSPEIPPSQSKISGKVARQAPVDCSPRLGPVLARVFEGVQISTDVAKVDHLHGTVQPGLRGIIQQREVITLYFKIALDYGTESRRAPE